MFCSSGSPVSLVSDAFICGLQCGYTVVYTNTFLWYFFLLKNKTKTILHLFIYCVCVHATELVERSEDHLQEAVLSFHHMVPRFGSRCVLRKVLSRPVVLRCFIGTSSNTHVYRSNSDMLCLPYHSWKSSTGPKPFYVLSASLAPAIFFFSLALPFQKPVGSGFLCKRTAFEIYLWL